jgi:hypothetical protein
LSKKVPTTDEAKPKIASACPSKEKKNISYRFKKKGTMFLVLEEKSKHC